MQRAEAEHRAHTSSRLSQHYSIRNHLAKHAIVSQSLDGTELEAKSEGGAEKVILGVEVHGGSGGEADVAVELLVEAEGGGGAVSGGLGDGHLSLNGGVGVNGVGSANGDTGVGDVGAVEANGGSESDVLGVLVEGVQVELVEERAGTKGHDRIAGGVAEADVAGLVDPRVIKLATVGATELVSPNNKRTVNKIHLYC